MRYEASSDLGFFQGIAINQFPRHNITKFLLKGFMSHGSAFYDLFQFGFFSFFRFFVVQSFVCKQSDIPVHRNIRNLGCQRFYHTVFKTFHDSVLRRFNLIFKFHSLVLSEIIIFQPSDKLGIHFIVVPIRGWLHGLHRRLFRFTQHSVNFGRKNLLHVFTFDLHPNPHISPIVKF